MSTFEVKPRRVTVLPHPDPEVHSLALGQIDGYMTVIGKDSLQTGDLAVYIPEQAIVPEELQEEMGLVGRLAGKNKDRVKAIRLRGVLSQGLLYRPSLWPEHWTEDVDVASELGISKWVPEIPAAMAGEVTPPPEGFCSYTDIENIKRYPEMFTEGEQVRFSEKLHGTCCIVGILNGERVVSSKGIANKGLTLQEDESNLYWRVAREQDLFKKLERFLGKGNRENKSVLIFGEILGVQDLKYGFSHGRYGYRAFDVMVDGLYIHLVAFDSFCHTYNIETVPVLYEGPFSTEKMHEIASGPSTLAGHIREGIVIKPEYEQTYEGRRKIAKCVSPAYLLRKGDTTEFE